MLACMKMFSSLGAIIVLLLGIGCAGVTFYGFTQSQIFLNDTATRNMVLGIMLASSIFIIVAAVLGICGLRKKSALQICIFQISVIIFFIGFLTTGLVAEPSIDQFFQGNCTDSNNEVIVQAHLIYEYSKQAFCQPGCPCGLTDQAINKYSPETQDILRSYSRKIPGPVSTQKCSNDISEKNKTMASALGEVEKLFHCSGWCQDYGDNFIYRFYDVNKGPPSYYCYQTIKDEADHYGSTISLTAYLTAAFLLLVAIVNICICCHPERRKLDMMSRFVVMRNENGQYRAV